MNNQESSKIKNIKPNVVLFSNIDEASEAIGGKTYPLKRWWAYKVKEFFNRKINNWTSENLEDNRVGN